MTSELNKIRTEVGEWSKENFGDQPTVNPLMGIDEEKGELVHSILKQRQGIREGEEGVGEEAEKDAVGDMFVYLCDFAYRNDIEFWDVTPNEHKSVAKAWHEVTDQYSQMATSFEYGDQLLDEAVNVFLCELWELCKALGYSFRECVELAWYDEVKDREWDSDYV